MIKKLLALSAIVASSAFADVSITGQYRYSDIVMTSNDWAAGGICSVTFRGKQYVACNDHGQGWQSASSFNWLGEAYNPTEQGSSMFFDGFAPTPSKYSRLMYRRATENTLITDTKMAFWSPVWNGNSSTLESNHYLTKEIKIGALGYSNVISFKIRFDVPRKDIKQLTAGQFEVLTTYLPPEFSLFFTHDFNGVVQALSDGPGEQGKPIIFSTPDYLHSVALYSPDMPTGKYAGTGFGRWRFPNCCTKINYVMRYDNPSGDYNFRAFVVVGTYFEVVDTLTSLRTKFNK